MRKVKFSVLALSAVFLLAACANNKKVSFE
jgi:outer membrane biogenesis lipoprotein LolB